MVDTGENRRGALARPMAPRLGRMAEIISIHTAAAIVAAAELRLRQSPYFYLKGLQCRFDAGVLTLCGRVPYRQLKHLAEAIVSRVEGVQRVANEVEVVDPTWSASAAPRARSAG
jgi:osmotically-inducible protein OsmY